MPKVPTYDNFQTTPGVLPNPGISNVISPEKAAIGGKQMQEFGNAVQDFGGAMGGIALDVQREANQLRVDDANNQRKELELRLTYDKETGFSNIRGVDALQRKSGKPLADEYLEYYREGVSKIADTLGNAAQKQQFIRDANQGLIQFHAAATKHEGDQFHEYALSVREGTIKNRIDEIGLNYNNPAKVDEAITSIKAATYDQARLLGKSAEWAEAQARDMTSQGHLRALGAALQNNDPKFADGYLKRNAKNMSSDDILRANGLITKQLDGQIAVETAASVMQDVVKKIDTPRDDRAFNIALNTESGNRQFSADGTPITSPKGAIGIAQIMPATGPEAAKLAGLPWDENKLRTDENYNRALGKAYFDKQLKDFGGNLAQAYAAYNAGPGATREAVKRAEKEGGNWVSYLPQETQNYVQKNMTAFAAGDGQYKKPTLLDIQTAVREKIGTGSPERLKMALDEAERQFEDVNKAVKQRNEEAVATAMRAVMENGGRFTDLPADVQAAVPPEEVGKVMDFAKKIAKGEEPETDWALYYGLKSAPTGLAQINLMAFRNRLNDTEFKELVNLQNEVIAGKSDTLDKLRSGKDVLNQFMREAGIDPSPKDTDKKGSAKVGKVWSMFEARIRTRETQLGRPLNANEQRDEAARMFVDVDVPGMLYGTNRKPYAAAYAEGQKVEIPENDRKQIVAALRAKRLVPTDDVVELMYLRQKELSNERQPVRRCRIPIHGGKTPGVYEPSYRPAAGE